MVTGGHGPAGLSGLPRGGVTGGHGPFIGRAAGQRLARAELSKPIYHQHLPLEQRILGYLATFLSHLFGRATAVPGGWWGLVALGGEFANPTL